MNSKIIMSSQDKFWLDMVGRLTVGFVMLKLMNVIVWPWPMVLSPLWIPIVVAGLALATTGGAAYLSMRLK